MPRRTLLRAVIASSAALVLTWTLVSPVAAEEVPEEVIPTDQVPVSELVPPMESDPLEIPQGTIPEGDFSTPLEAPSEIVGKGVGGHPPIAGNGDASFDEDTSVVVERDEFSTTYDNVNETSTTVVGYEPLNAEVAGEWVPIDTMLQPVANSGWSTSAHPLSPSFAGTADAENAFTISRDGYDIGFTLMEASGSAATRPYSPRQENLGNQLIYRDVFDDVDLTYEVNRSGVKEALILHEVPEQGESTWRWHIDASALDVSIDEHGVINFADRYGDVQFFIPIPVMWDSSGIEGQSEPALAPLTPGLARDGDGWVLSLSAQRSWLAAPERVYPVTVDPSLWYGTAAYYAYKSDVSWTSPARTDGIHIGNPQSGAANSNWRTVAGYNFPQVAGKQLLQAAFGVYYLGGTNLLRNVSVWDATCFGYACNGPSAWVADTFTDESKLLQSSTLSTKLAEKVRDGLTSYHFLFVGQEDGNYTYKQIGADLFLEWKNKPSVTPVAPLAATPAPKTTVFPKFEAKGVGESGFVISYQFKVDVRTSTSPETWSTLYSPSFGKETTMTVPDALDPAKVYRWSVRVRDNADAHLGIGNASAWSSPITFTPTLPSVSPLNDTTALPAKDQILTTTTPTLTAIAPVASGTTYQFRVATGVDGKSGLVASSGWLPIPANKKLTWTVPAGTLLNGGSYVWGVSSTTGTDVRDPEWTRTFRVDQRLGASGPSPFDTAGPVTVNLANGNAALSFASPTVATVGGPMGMAFSYNSQQDPSLLRGLTGRYYNALTPGQTSTTTFDFAGKELLLTRTDPFVNSNWLDESPAPAVPNDYFLARWTGYITPPVVPGSTDSVPYEFGVWRDDGARLSVNGSQVVNLWTAGSSTGEEWGTPISLTPGQAVPINLEYFERAGGARIELWVRYPGKSKFVVPADWFSRQPAALPAGWSSSTAIAGSGSVYSSAQVNEGSVALTDMSGVVHTYSKTSDGGYTPPAGEYGVLALTDGGRVTLSDESGTVTQFNAAGKVESITSAADAMKRAAPSIVYETNGLVDKIVDPLSAVGTSAERAVDFWYHSESSSYCPAESGYSRAKPDLLCAITYPASADASIPVVRLLYNSAGQLTRIKNPGEAITDFKYDTSGRLSGIRDAAANDWIAANAATQSATTKNQVVIVYDTNNRVDSVTLPAPDGQDSLLQPRKDYTYDVGKTLVDVAGLDVTGSFLGHAQSVTYDSSWRQVTATSAMGVTASQEWAAKDMVLSSTDNWGYKSTSIYNQQDRVTDAYGPAPVGCFNSDRTVKSACASTTAHTSTAYDQGLKGLHVAYFPKKDLSGVPTLFSLGIGVASGAVDKDWGATSPGTGILADDWSMRMTGLVTFPAAGDYSFQTVADDGTRVWIDDRLIVDNWRPQSAGQSTEVPRVVVTAAGQQKRIRIEYFEQTGNSSIQLRWTTPGTVLPVVVPGANLTPDYGLPNGVTVQDAAPTGSGLSNSQVPSIVTALSYTSPWLGTPTSSTIDPGASPHLDLTTATTYEAASTTTGWMRRTSRMLPAAVATGQAADSAAATQYKYFGDQQTMGNSYGTTSTVCGVPPTTIQAGLLKSANAPSPTGVAGEGVNTWYIYDSMGRVAGVRMGTSGSGWICTSYDLRGRVDAVTYPGGRTADYVYTASPEGLVSSVADGAVSGSANGSKITTVTDLLGRVILYTDVWGTETVPTYEDKTGRLESIATTAVNKQPSVQSFEYDFDGKVEKVYLDGNWIADPSYADKLLSSIAYMNNTTLAIGRDTNNATNALTWAFPDKATPAVPVPVPAQERYSGTFESDVDSWATVDGALDASTAWAHAGAASTQLSQTDPGVAPTMTRTVTGLTVGRWYTYTAWVAAVADSAVATSVKLGVSGMTDGASTTAPPSVDGAVTWTQLSYPFQATAASQDLAVTLDGASVDASIAIDDVLLMEDARTDPGVPGTTPQPSVADSVVRSQAGRIMKNVLTDGGTVETSTYSYDAAGRLVKAMIPRHELSYTFAQTSSCGAGTNTAAGRSGNRTGFQDKKDGAVVTSVAYCYNWADQLISTASTAAGANAVTATDLSTASSTLAYDTRGNTTVLANQTLQYDSANRHTKTTVVDGAATTVVSYVRDVTGRIVARTAGGVTVKYLYSGGGLFATQVGSGPLERSVSLPGGVQVLLNSDATRTWSYPNLHGDVVVVADGAGVRAGARFSYDPFGQPIDANGNIGTVAADEAVPDNSEGEADHGWVGQHQKLYEHAGSIASIEMGVRVYIPALGRFLSVDPVEGGVTNAYDYPSDPINKFDLSGALSADGAEGWAKNKAKLNGLDGVQRPRPLLRKPPSMGPAGPYIQAPPDCMTGTNNCRSFDSGLEACVVVCLGSVTSMLEDGTRLKTMTLGAGLKAGATGSIGGGSNKTPGDAIGWSCAGAIGWGLYWEGSMGVDWAVNGGPVRATGFDAGGGALTGAGAGCSLTYEITWVE